MTADDSLAIVLLEQKEHFASFQCVEEYYSLKNDDGSKRACFVWGWLGVFRSFQIYVPDEDGTGNRTANSQTQLFLLD
eukprot:scaffold394_cov161-Chaetoceros_neogracile.AAC.6